MNWLQELLFQFLSEIGKYLIHRILELQDVCCIIYCFREYKEDLTDVYSNVDVRPDASMAQLWETAVKDDKQEKKLIAGVS